jgi:hypothetical protein
MVDGFRPERSGNFAWSSRTRRCAQRKYDPPAPNWKGKDTVMREFRVVKSAADFHPPLHLPSVEAFGRKPLNFDNPGG